MVRAKTTVAVGLVSILVLVLIPFAPVFADSMPWGETSPGRMNPIPPSQ